LRASPPAQAMLPRTRRTLLLLLLGALAAAALLEVALPTLRLAAGMPLPEVHGGRVEIDVPGLGGAGGGSVRWAVVWVLAAGAGCAVLYAAWRGLRGLRLAGAAAVLGRGLLLVAVVASAAATMLLLGPRPGSFAGAPLPLPAPPAPRSPLGAPPPAVLWLTAAGLLLASALAAAWLLRPRPPARPALGLVGLEAERAREALLAGEDARGVIVACYARMSAALAEERGIERPGPMTAREFSELLGTLGVPATPVRELTLLFEVARYGRGPPGPAEEARALACLGPIVDHCRAAGEA
jgi:hypothetical protein